MRIMPKAVSWTEVSNRLSGFLTPAKRKTAPPSERSHHDLASNKFYAWGSSARYRSLLGLDFEVTKIDIKSLEQFVAITRPQQLSEQRLLSSHLQNQPINEGSHEDLKRALAVERMLGLVSRTIADMKMIELYHISRTKG